VSIGSSPIVGISAPVTIAGSVLSHTIDTLAGVTLAQVVKPGAKVLIDGCPTIFDFRTAYASVNSIEACLVTSGFAAMSKYYGIPVYGWVGSADAKTVDYQAGYEAAMGTMISALSGVDLLRCAGGLDSLIAYSLEKMVIDAEMLGFVHRLQQGILVSDDTLAKAQIAEIKQTGEFLSNKHTAKWFKQEQAFLDDILDHQNYANWKANGSVDIIGRAKAKLAAIGSQPGYLLDGERLAHLNAAMQEIAASMNTEVPLD
jgi:trimethylamine--corrinoid protein Co-methyltransferase